MSQQEKPTAVATINNVQIVVMDENQEPLVPIKPICEALGVDYSGQLQKLKDDDFFSSTMGLSPTVGADKKNREMASLPLKYALLWLGSINPKNVAPEAKDSVMRYKEECANALYNHFFGYMAFERERKASLQQLNDAQKEQRRIFREAKKRIAELQSQIDDTLALEYSEYLNGQKQLPINFPES